MRAANNESDAVQRQRFVDDLKLSTSKEHTGARTIVKLIGDLLPCRAASFTLIDRREELFVARFGLRGPATRVPAVFGAHVVWRRRPVTLGDVSHDPSFYGHGLSTTHGRIRSFCGVPIRVSGQENVGALCAFDEKADHFSPEFQKTLHNFGRLLQDELRLQTTSVRDYLTGLYNRRFFDEMGGREWGRAKRDTFPMSILLLDVDHFKNYNDRYGHPAGDRVLRLLADAMRNTFRRAGDLLARYGGEEFAAILPQTDRAGGKRAGERLCQAIADLQIEHAGSKAGVVTISVGVATASSVNDFSNGFNEHVVAADSALYMAKHNGRNGVSVAV